MQWPKVPNPVFGSAVCPPMRLHAARYAFLAKQVCHNTSQSWEVNEWYGNLMNIFGPPINAGFRNSHVNYVPA